MSRQCVSGLSKSMGGREDTYSLLRHSCRAFSQAMMEKAKRRKNSGVAIEGPLNMKEIAQPNLEACLKCAEGVK